MPDHWDPPTYCCLTTIHLIIGTLQPTALPWLPVPSNIEPPVLQYKSAVNRAVHETLIAETRPRRWTLETKTRPIRWPFCSRRDRDRDVPIRDETLARLETVSRPRRQDRDLIFVLDYHRLFHRLIRISSHFVILIFCAIQFSGPLLHCTETYIIGITNRTPLPNTTTTFQV